MDEYISRKEAIKGLSAEALERNLDSVMTDDAHRYRRAAERVIAEVPAADVRPVVLCRDCKYYPYGTDCGEERGLGLEWPDKRSNLCPFLCVDGWLSRKPLLDFYCAYGKRKERK